MKKIRDAATIIGMLEGGELAQALSGDIVETLGKLKTLSDVMGKKAKVKGKVVLSLEFEVEASTVEVLASIETKVPKAPRSRSFYWVTDDGAISTQHPQQDDMFAGPRDVGRSSAS